MAVEDIREALQNRGWSLAVAESLTGGLLANRFAAAPEASAWFRGAVVAYSRSVKHEVLGVPEGPVVSRESALAMAGGAARLLGAEVGLAVTGVGGPARQDGEPPGTVWMAVSVCGNARAQEVHLDGEPVAVCDSACDAAVELLTRSLTGE